MAQKSIPQAIIKMSFNFSVWFIERFNTMQPYNKQLAELRDMPEGTLGNDIAQCLDDHKLRLVPKFESHDLKHVLLDYKMTPVDEIRMQAFMLGNGNYTLPCIAILLFGMLLLPGKWSVFYTDFIKGRATRPISTWSIEEYAHNNTAELRNSIMKPSTVNQPVLTMKAIAKFGAFAAIFAGISGMLLCLPFLFSSSMEDLVGAGFPFVGGAILVVGGLFTLSNLAIKQQPVTAAAI